MAKYTSIGGQALIEGIMMKSPEKTALAVRMPDKSIDITYLNGKSVREKYKILKLPILRGIAGFIESMLQGYKAMMLSADKSGFTDLDEEEKEKTESEKKKEGALMSVIMVIASVLGVALAVVLFMLLPTFLAGLVDPYIHSAALHNLIEGVVKVAVFLGYLILCSKQKDVKRVFAYHGAEHKTIFCYEAGLELTVENARKQPRHHPRCGTSFLFVVIIVSILFSSVVFSFVEWKILWVRVAVHILLLVPVVGITYEFNRYVGGHNNAVTRFLSKPGLWMQNFTTFEPDDAMLEVAIEALKLVLPDEKGADKW